MNLPSIAQSGWRNARVTSIHPEARSAYTIGLKVPGWRGHLAGQHIDLKLTADDGYSAQRSYSLSRPADGEHIELTVQRIPDGEVSPYLAGLKAGEQVEVRGPIGGWFVWRPGQAARVLLIGGGSGIVPLMAMLRLRMASDDAAEFRIIYSVRTREEIYYSQELNRLETECDWLQITLIYTRSAPPQTLRAPGRIGTDDLALTAWRGDETTCIYVCGPTGFVESVTTDLIDRGHQPSTIRTERFGSSD
jgi:ferredoxin-NADP reductase